MDNHGLHLKTVQETEQEMSRAAERVERFRSAWGDSYDLQQVMYEVYSMLPTCKTCGAYVPNYVEELERHRRYHESLITVVELLWGLYPGGPVVDLAYAPHQLGELVRRMAVRCQ